MMIDIHTHVLPGVDDGPKDWETSLSMLADCAKLGVKKVIATPHYYPWQENVAAEEIKKLCKQAETKLREEFGLEMEVLAGHEIYYCVDVTKALKRGEVLTLADSKYVLVEFGIDEPFSVICRAVREFVDQGYIPIVAHVERYENLYQESNLDELKEYGALLQANIGALKDSFFDKRSRWLKKHFNKKKIDFIASDMHNLSGRPPYTEERLQRLRKLAEPKYIDKLLYQNGEKIILNHR